MSIGVEKAVLKVQDFFRKQCGGAAQTYWELLEATEDPVKGVYEIHCKEKCYLDPFVREHIVWVDLETGEIAHSRRVLNGER